MTFSKHAAIAFTLACGLAAGWAAEPPVSFRQEIAPLLQRRCAACHSEESAKGGYRLDSLQADLQGRAIASGRRWSRDNAGSRNCTQLLVEADAR